MKIVFLDVDGVLNSEEFFRERVPEGSLLVFSAHIDPKAVERLNRITDTTGASIVVSSSWRRFFSTDAEMREFFHSVGVKADILGCTPIDPDEVRRVINGYTTRGWIDRVFRGHEIHAWLLNWDTQDKWGTPKEVDGFIILDDGTDMEYLSHRLVQTQFETGLTDTEVTLSIEKLREAH